uniref:Uncharacterized protein n=1 Tax=Anopheles atroparvus TaxID=41427 RepID=A0A182J4T8_ANOAO
MLALGRRSASEDGRLRDDELLVPLLSIDSQPDDEDDEATTHSGVVTVHCPVAIAPTGPVADTAPTADTADAPGIPPPAPPPTGGGNSPTVGPWPGVDRSLPNDAIIIMSVQSTIDVPGPGAPPGPTGGRMLPLGPTDVPVEEGLMALEPDEDVPLAEAQAAAPDVAIGVASVSEVS